MVIRVLMFIFVFYYKLSSIPTAPGYVFFLGHSHLIGIIMLCDRCCVTNAVRLFLQEVRDKTDPKLSSNGIFKVFLGPIPLVILSSPETATVVYKNYNLPKSYIVYDMSKLLMRGLVNINGQEFKHHKKIISACLGGGNYIEIAGKKADLTIKEDFLSKKHKSNFVISDISLMTTKFTEGCLWDAAGISHEQDYFSDDNIKSRWKDFSHIERFVAGIDWLPWHLFRFMLPFSEEGRRVQESMKRWNDVSQKPVEKYKESFEKLPKTSFIRALLEENNRNPNNFTIYDTVEEVKTIVAGGVKTTSNLLTWTLHLLGHNIPVQEKICEEVDKIFAGKQLDYIPNYEDFNQLIYTKAVVKEGMRLHANGALIGRQSQEEIVIFKGDLNIDDTDISSSQKFVIPKWTEIALSIESINTNPRHWKNPDHFDPVRHLDTKKHPYAFSSFSGGPRRCPGQNIARIEALAFLVRIFREFKIKSLNHTDSLKRELFISLHVIDPVKIQFTRRAFPSPESQAAY
jgi:cytochrome P450